jgi:hypothetical protein
LLANVPIQLNVSRFSSFFNPESKIFNFFN